MTAKDGSKGRFMGLALELAARGRGRTSPNPMVGAVVVRNGRIVGRGWHRCCGSAHAEVGALRSAGGKAKGADMYVTLEPCCNWGRTPPCTDAIIRSGIKQVFAAMEDPNPAVKGKGIRLLRAAGIRVFCGLRGEDAERLNEFYITWVRKKRPFVLMKVAMTSDGKISYGNGRRKEITGREAKGFVHGMRSEVDAVAVGINTVLKDNPRLTVRIGGGKTKGRKAKNPLRVVLDSSLRIPLNARVLKGTGRAKTVVATTGRGMGKKGKIKKLLALGAGVMLVKEKDGMVDLGSLLHELGNAGITSVMLEGGKKLNTSFLGEKLVDKIILLVSGRKAGNGLDWADGRVLRRIGLRDACIGRLGRDAAVSFYPVFWKATSA